MYPCDTYAFPKFIKEMKVSKQLSMRFNNFFSMTCQVIISTLLPQVQHPLWYHNSSDTKKLYHCFSQSLLPQLSSFHLFDMCKEFQDKLSLCIIFIIHVCFCDENTTYFQQTDLEFCLTWFSSNSASMKSPWREYFRKLAHLLIKNDQTKWDICLRIVMRH